MSAQGNAVFFSDLDESDDAVKPSKPIWAMDLDSKQNEKAILEWLNGTKNNIMEVNEQRHRMMERNLALYKGIQYRDQETRRDIRDRSEDRSRTVKKITVNNLYDLTQHKVSRLVKFKPAVAVLPTNDEFDDKNSAKANKLLLDHIQYIHNFDGKVINRFAREAKILGESYFFITWDKNLGDIHPDFKKLKDDAESKGETRRIPLLDENGVQEKDDAGHAIWIEEEVKTGDVSYEIAMPFDVLVEADAKEWESAKYLFRRHVDPVQSVRLRFPKAASKIKASEDVQVFNFMNMQLEPAGEKTVWYEFYHRKTPELPGGRYIAFTSDGILSNTKFPFSHTKMPCVRLTDIELPGELHGISFFEVVKGLTGTYNNLTNLILRNQILVSHPKWMMPAGSAKLDSLGNDITVVQFKGPQAPQLVQATPTPSEVFAFRDKLKEEIQQVGGVFGVSRGEPPPGIKAGVALQFLNEQENERTNEDILKWNEAMKEIAQMTLAVAGDYYEADDQRMIRVLGKNGQWMSQSFDKAHLSKDYDVRVQNTSALPRSVAARTQTLLDLNERFPDRFSADQVIEMLDLAQSDKFTDSATVNVRQAEAENESIMDGGKEDRLHPEKWEDHIVHWKIHIRQMQDWSFKMLAPEKVQQRLKDHVLVHEMFMIDFANQNPAYGEKLRLLDSFPAVMELPRPAPAPVPGPDEPAPIAPGIPGGIQAPGIPGGIQGLPPDQELPVNEELGGPPAEPAAPEAPALTPEGEAPPEAAQAELTRSI